ncbi:hypothetical protein [Prosthecobacter sp.]|uniref:hypothetical protein n=1 Tax=Prosthecobacter sp. TaxID=1965333 RepID=UPI003784BE4A
MSLIAINTSNEDPRTPVLRGVDGAAQSEVVYLDPRYVIAVVPDPLDGDSYVRFCGHPLPLRCGKCCPILLGDYIRESAAEQQGMKAS